MAEAPVAMAIARLLVQNLLQFCSFRVGVLHDRILKLRRVERWRERSFWNLGMKRRSRLFGLLPGTARHGEHTHRSCANHCNARHNSTKSIHHVPPASLR